MDERSKWNQAAADYQKTVRAPDGRYPEQLIAFLRQRGALTPGSRVADIGCGAGKYALRFAELGCSLLLLDIADNMMAYTKQNLADYAVPVETAVCDWSETDPAEKGWEKSVDLAFASMTPAIRTAEDLWKLCAVSRGFCFISKFLSLDNLLYRAVADACGVPLPVYGPTGEDSLALVRQLIDWDYLPEVRCVRYGWENRLSLEEAESRILGSNLGPLLQEQSRSGKVREALRALSGAESWIPEVVQSKAIWIFWDVTGR